MAHHDLLTGLSNRALFMEKIEEAGARLRRRGETFTVVRRGNAIATIAPARHGSGADLRRLLTEHPPDDAWNDDLRDLRRFVCGIRIANT